VCRCIHMHLHCVCVHRVGWWRAAVGGALPRLAGRAGAALGPAPCGCS
jgi:hypothetical protein